MLAELAPGAGIRTMAVPLHIRAAQALGRALVDGAIAGMVAGVIDAAIVVERSAPMTSGPGGALAALALALGLSVLAGLALGAPLVLALRGVGWHPGLRRLRARLATPGAPRVGALVELAGAALAALAAGVAIARITLAIEGRFHAPGATAALIAAAAVTIGLATLYAFTAVVPPLARAASARAWAHRATRGKAGALAAAGAGVVGALVLDRALARVAPAWDAGPTEVLALAGACTVAIAAFAPAARLGLARATAAGTIAAVLALSALGAIGRVDAARGAIAEHGVVSARVLASLWRLTDGDGDGFGRGFGARDCDDRDPRVHPHAIDVAGDGVDGNCAGGDPDPAALAVALAARAPREPQTTRHDVVLVTIDSVRADHTSLAGHRWPTTPQLAALAGRGARFDRAHAPAPLTRRAVPAILYGRMAATLPFSPSRRWPLLLDSSLPTLASTLAAAGYRTAAIVSHRRLPLSEATYRGFAEVIGLSDELVSRHHDNADAVIDRALAWWAAAADRPRFLWVHLIDPHHPYTPPPSAPALGPGASAYDRELAFADLHLGRLLAALSADRTIIAVTADHGEAFGERHHRFHGHGLEDVETHVPLVIAAPGGRAVTSAVPVGLVDLAPTLLDLAGLAIPAGMTGASLAETVRAGAPPPDRPVLTELFADGIGRELVAVHQGHRALIRDLAAWTVTAYDVEADPRQRAPLTDPATIAALVRALELALDRDHAALPP